ncbi:regulator of G-protein signaling 21-like isoform X2 [Parambassis ranga]|uniref:Regulator of G-protein signaling 21-like isoform X2 n=1 Tax=Parambassis ranga TaxID=210632 RepID=A0A6P7I3K7_9TELE|nr:regulator of G-protein signaling 21-like isoform X2 [Parambassis ranga]
MPKLLFSKIRFHELKDLMPNMKRPRRHKKDVQGLTVQKLNNDVNPSNLSWETDHKVHLTLERLLRDKKYLAAFRSFLKSEFSEENVDFWLACEEFRSTACPDNLHWRAEEMYKRFIQPKACREVNVDHHIREKIKKSLDKPSHSCFDEAQKHVYLLMERDSCPRFLHSDAYLSLKRKSRTMWYI